MDMNCPAHFELYQHLHFLIHDEGAETQAKLSVGAWRPGADINETKMIIGNCKMSGCEMCSMKK